MLDSAQSTTEDSDGATTLIPVVGWSDAFTPEDFSMPSPSSDSAPASDPAEGRLDASASPSTEAQLDTRLRSPPPPDISSSPRSRHSPDVLTAVPFQILMAPLQVFMAPPQIFRAPPQTLVLHLWAHLVSALCTAHFFCNILQCRES
ncbi:hypothetical protein AMECASPLE_037245 [Ameca splendens]|uniref:Uncharacterized protein n=1 Tax=Ameca splendens TaxID=208324 RepID=A0ABV0ZHC4_9TELE